MHRLLAEYRQTLLLQQSLHANSMSTPNLAASQELHAAGNSGGGQQGGSNNATSNALSPPHSFEETSVVINHDKCYLQRTNARRADYRSCQE